MELRASLPYPLVRLYPRGYERAGIMKLTIPVTEEAVQWWIELADPGVHESMI
jgi:hypothetical protein